MSFFDTITLFLKIWPKEISVVTENPLSYDNVYEVGRTFLYKTQKALAIKVKKIWYMGFYQN